MFSVGAVSVLVMRLGAPCPVIPTLRLSLCICLYVLVPIYISLVNLSLTLARDYPRLLESTIAGGVTQDIPRP
jgi:hypothetical protein